MTKFSSSVLLDCVLTSNIFHNDVVVAMNESNAVNKKNWKRASKKRIKEFDSYNVSVSGFDEMCITDAGFINEVLLHTVIMNWKNKTDKQLPWERCFFSDMTNSDLELFVWTTHDDTQIIGWSISEH